MTASVKPPLALLIDGENVTHQIAPALLQTAMSLGDPIVRRVYGHTLALEVWKDSGGDHALTLHHPTGAVAGKNAADIAMVIGAMDLLHTTPIRHFCVVSSDSDFSGLALRLREAGCTVFGVGRKGSPAALRTAYRKFITIESLKPASDPRAVPVLSPQPSPVDKIVPFIERALGEAPDQRVPTNLSFVGTCLRAYLPAFKPSAYGHSKLSSLIESTKLYDFKTLNGVVYVSRKPVAGSAHH